MFLSILLPLSALALVAYNVVGGDSRGSPVNGAPKGPDLVESFFLSSTVLLLSCFFAGRLATLLGQPRVLGEIAAGLLLGPSQLGALIPGPMDRIFPSEVLPMMSGLAQLGLVLFMFGVGRELATIRLRGLTTQALMVSQASLLVPLALGSAAALLLVDRFLPAGTHPGVFVFFIGCAISITAFPVLAKIVTETGLSQTLPGQLGMIVAALGDGGSWILLGVIVAVAHGTGMVSVFVGALVAAALVALLLSPLRLSFTRLISRTLESSSSDALSVLAIIVVGAAALTSALGAHQLIGALVIGIIWPSGKALADQAASLVAAVCPLLLPFFFFGFGLTVDLTSLTSGRGTLLIFVLILVVSVVSKVAGVVLTARVTKIPWRDSVVLGVLLNTRGLTEMVVLQIGYDAGIIGPELLALMTLSALVTTFTTGPLLWLLGYRSAPGLRLSSNRPESDTFSDGAEVLSGDPAPLGWR